jgi:hypothetical protein
MSGLFFEAHADIPSGARVTATAVHRDLRAPRDMPTFYTPAVANLSRSRVLASQTDRTGNAADLDATLRFDLPAGHGGTDLCWTLYVDEPAPDGALIGHMLKRVNQLINANLRHTFGQQPNRTFMALSELASDHAASRSRCGASVRRQSPNPVRRAHPRTPRRTRNH